MSAGKRSTKGHKRQRLARTLKKTYRRSRKVARVAARGFGRISRAMWRAAFPARRKRRPQSEAPVGGVEPFRVSPRQILTFVRGHRAGVTGGLLVIVIAAMLVAALTAARAGDPSCTLRVQVDIPDFQPYWPRVRQWCPHIMQAAAKSQLDPSLIAALILVESGGNPTITSANGAVGLMQIMPSDGIAAEFQCPTGPCFRNRPTIAELQDPGFNAEYGAMLIRYDLDRTGSLREALRSYGPLYVGYNYADLVLATYQAVSP